MPVTNTHPDFDLALPQWTRIADALDGTDAVKRAGDAYLPMLDGHRENPDSHARYVSGALFYGATERTVAALVGAVFRKDPTVEVPARIKPRLDNVNGAGDGIYTFAKRLVRHVLSFGRYGLLVEAPTPGDDGRAPLPDPASAASGLPWIAGYEARDIRCWRTRLVAGTPVLDQVILQEQVEVPGDDEFGFKVETQYRVLDLDEAGLYRVRLFRRTGRGYEAVREYLPTPTGKRIPYIPFTFVGPNDLRPEVSRAPILDLVDVNLSHFRSSADLEEGRSKLAFPLPVVVGAESEPFPLKFGGNWALWLPAGGDAKFLEFTGNGLSELAAALPQKENYMAALGARLLQEPKRAAEAAETQYLRQSSENSTLASCAKTAADALKVSLSRMAEWVSASGEVTVELNTDFFDVPLAPATVTALVAAVQANLLPIDEFLWVLKQGEMIRDETSIEDARRMLEQEQPALLGRAMDLGGAPAPGTPARAGGTPPARPPAAANADRGANRATRDRLDPRTRRQG